MTRRYPSGSIPPLRAALTALAALLFLSRAALAQGGVTVDRWQLVPGQAAEARGITADPFGSLYAAGSAYEKRLQHRPIHRPQTCQRGVFLREGGRMAARGGLCVQRQRDRHGRQRHRLRGGRGQGRAERALDRAPERGRGRHLADHRQLPARQRPGGPRPRGGGHSVRRRVRGGYAIGQRPLRPVLGGAAHARREAQFRTVDQFQYVSGKGAAAFALTVARSGAVYVGGRSTDKSGYVSMHVRLSTDNGASFSTIEASRFRLTTKGGATAHSIAVRSSATGSVAEDTVYVAGAADGANGYPAGSSGRGRMASTARFGTGSPRRACGATPTR
jgi:hypothetical protein